MDFEKEYKNLVAKVKNAHLYAQTDSTKNVLEDILPELRESEEETTRKELLDFVRSFWADHKEKLPQTTRWVNYLEKQKERKFDFELIKQAWYMEGYKDREFGKEPRWIIKTGEGGPEYELNPKYGQPLAKEQKPERINITEMVAKYEATDEYVEGEYKGKPVNCMIRAYEQGIRDTLLKVKEQKPAEWSEEDEANLKRIIRVLEDNESDWSELSDWLKSLRPDNYKNCNSRWSEEEAKKAAEDYADEYPGMTHENDGSTIEDYDKPYNDFMAGVLWAKHHGVFQNGNTHWKPSEEKKKETPDGVDIGYGLETAIDILENGFTHYQTDDGEYERKQALDVLIFLLNETRKKEDAKLWSKDIVESIVTWATEKLQLYSMKESTPYVEAVKNNAQKVLDWAKEQWPIYYGWKPTEEQMEALQHAINACESEWAYQDDELRSLLNDIKKL